MPLDLNVKILSNPDSNKGDHSNSFAQLLGELQFIAIATCPDITYAVNHLALYITNPSMQHQIALKSILWYLSETRSYGIAYNYAINPLVTFKGFIDVTYANQKDGKLTKGYIYIAAKGTITWQFGKQSVTAQSTIEAEYIAMWDMGKEASWLRNLYKDLLFTQENPTMIICDNTRAVAIAKNPLYYKWTKHIDPHFHWIRKKIQDGRFKIEYCATAEQSADIMPKALPCPKYVKHIRDMGLSPVWRGVLGLSPVWREVLG